MSNLAAVQDRAVAWQSMAKDLRPKRGTPEWVTWAVDNFPEESDRERLRTIARLHPTAKATELIMQEADRLRRDAERKLDEAKVDLKFTERQRAAYSDMIAWIDRQPWGLEPIASSALHRVLEEGVLRHKEITAEMPGILTAAGLGAPAVFLVQHDWAALMRNAQVDDGDVRLPFDLCAFEFALSRRRVILLIVCDEGNPRYVTPLMQTAVGWWLPSPFQINEVGELSAEWGGGGFQFKELVEALMGQVRAVAITLDAEVTQAEIVRAPERLNAKRLRRGGVPIFDHRVVSPRHHHDGPGHGGGGGHSKRRLHFRRGHWRHYPSHKTWFKWCLVGDPALGFADKDYRL